MSLLLATILPSLLIILFFVNSDKFKEPTTEIIKVFSYGILITIPAFYLNTSVANYYSLIGVDEKLVGSFLTAAPIEEGLKLAVLYFFVFKMKDFNEPMDGIVYGVCASLGFATLENFYYVYIISDTFGTSAMTLALVRAFSAVPAHAVFGIFMGYFFMKYVFVKKGENLIYAFLIPFILHGFYNYFVYSNFLISLLIIVVAWIIGVRLFLSLKKKQKRKKREYEKKI